MYPNKLTDTYDFIDALKLHETHDDSLLKIVNLSTNI